MDRSKGDFGDCLGMNWYSRAATEGVSRQGMDASRPCPLGRTLGKSVPARALHRHLQERRPASPLASRDSADAIAELRSRRFIEIMTIGNRDRIRLANPAKTFTQRIRAINRYRLLDRIAGELGKYMDYCFVLPALNAELSKVVAQATGEPVFLVDSDTIFANISVKQWPEWVLEYLGDPSRLPSSPRSAPPGESCRSARCPTG